MSEEWDTETNLTVEEIQTLERERASSARHEEWRRVTRERNAVQLARREALGYFDIEAIPENDIIIEFPWHTVNSAWRRDIYTVNKTHWICHNCGTLSCKNDSCSELFKCNRCHSRNITLIKAGDISRLVRENSVGTNMEDVYERRRERFRVQRRERATREFDS